MCIDSWRWQSNNPNGYKDKYEVLNEQKESKDFMNISNKSLEKVWDNQEDSEYDK